jgi:membrane protein implicated in regulation of membrane protease activity
MIDAMWVWGAIGLILLGVEMWTGTFYVLWFGVAALILAVVMGLNPELNKAVQFALFAALSLGSLAIWRLNYKRNAVDARFGQARGEEIGRIGIVVEVCNANQEGKISFTQGVMGSRIWPAISDESLEVGTSAKIVAVEGNTLRIVKN